MKCRICQSDNVREYFKDCTDLEYGAGGKFNFLKCLTCGLVFISPTPSEKELVSFYPADYHGYNTPQSKLTRHLIKLNLKKRAGLYKKLIGAKGKILDIGSADGHHFDILNIYGEWHFVGIEFNDDIAKIGRKQEREIYTCSIENFNYPNESFDLIIMNHLIEHVVDPILTFNRAHDLLKPGGYIVGETPNIASWDFKIAGRFWGGLHTPRHTYLFNPDSLAKLAINTNFTVSNINFSLDTSHWALSVQNYFQRKHIDSRLVKGRAFYYPLLLLLFIPANIIQKIFKATGVMQYVFKKK